MFFRQVLGGILACAISVLVCSGCVVPKLNLERLPTETDSESNGSMREDAGEAGRQPQNTGGKGGAGAGGSAGGKGGAGGRGGSGGAGELANKGGGAGSVEGVDGGRDAGDEPDQPEEPTAAGVGGSGPSGGTGGGNGYPSGAMDAGVDAGPGSGGTGGVSSYCSTWRRQNNDGAFDDLGPNPGEEMNNSGTVRQFICRTVPDGRSQLALGKGVPPYGCYGTYETNGTRLGYGKSTDFEVLLPNRDCQVTWQSVTNGISPFDLGTAAQPGLFACRGRLMDVPSDGGGNVSGRELGQWVEVGGERQCWTQFHNSTAGQDTGSKRVVDQLEILVPAP
jgi:hypothetical protein